MKNTRKYLSMVTIYKMEMKSKPKDCKRCGKRTNKYWQVPFNKYDNNTKYFIACQACYDSYYKKEYENY